MKKLPKPPKIKSYENERNLGAALSFIFIVILVFIVMFYMDSVKPTADRQTLSITNSHFAYFIDEDYQYEDNPGAVFNADESIFVYFEVTGYKTVNTEEGIKASLTSDIQVLDPDRALVPQLSRKNVFDEDFNFDADYGAIPVKTEFTVPIHFPKGEYTFVQIIYDKMTGDAVRLSKPFMIE